MISYVIPVYNSCAYLYQTIESVIKQSDNIIIIDDCSNDDISYIKDYCDEIPSITWIRNNERMGAAFCRNLGNALAKNDIIAVCDAGDICGSDRSKKIINFFNDNPDKHLFYSDVIVIDALGNPLFLQKAIGWDGNSKPPISHPTVAYRRIVTDECQYHEGCLDTDFYEFFLLDCWNKGTNFGFINQPTYMKLDQTGSYNHRDVKKAKDEKFKKYQSYGINIKREEV
jgi:glycosyltransferase involved in cell wall biosynthesis